MFYLVNHLNKDLKDLAAHRTVKTSHAEEESIRLFNPRKLLLTEPNSQKLTKFQGQEEEVEEEDGMAKAPPHLIEQRLIIYIENSAKFYLTQQTP